MTSYIQTVVRYRAQIIAGLAGLGISLVAASFFSPDQTELTDTSEPDATLVSVTTAGEFTGQTSISLIGNVRAFSEAAVTAEQAGRVTGVPVRLGQTVAAGQIVATLENASQRAAVLQAEGVYEAALAAAAQQTVGTAEARNSLNTARFNAVTTYQSAYGTASRVVFTVIDPFFTSPNTSLPGLRIDGRGMTTQVNNTRVNLQSILTNWETKNQTITAESDFTSLFQQASADLTTVISLLDSFIALFSDQPSNSRYSDAELDGFIQQFSAARSELIGTQSSLTGALSQITAAQEALNRAELAASGSQNSAADAQVKQALGALRAAQANLNKTIIRTPIAGTVNELSVRTGDFIGGQQQIAEVANNNALEIVTAIGEQERDAFAVGDEVTIEGTVPGIVTEIAPAVSQNTGKIEVRIASESQDLQNGDTVTITRQATTTVDSRVFVPLSAVRFTETDGSVFVVEDGVLAARPVTLGVIRGGSVEITSGLTAIEQFVVDARGLQTGTIVEILE